MKWYKLNKTQTSPPYIVFYYMVTSVSGKDEPIPAL